MDHHFVGISTFERQHPTITIDLRVLDEGIQYCGECPSIIDKGSTLEHFLGEVINHMCTDYRADGNGERPCGREEKRIKIISSPLNRIEAGIG